LILNIIICVFNEEKTINELLNQVLNVSLEEKVKKNIIILDNNSTDNTKLILEKNFSNNNNIKIIYNKKNIGKGGSLIKSLNYCKEGLVVFQDADLEYDPNNYNDLIDELLKNNCDAVFGSRVLKGTNYHVYSLNKIAVNIFSVLINFFYNTNFTDTATNHKLIKLECLKKMKLDSKSFAIDFEIAIKLGKLQYKCSEIKIDYFPRTYEDGKKISLIDAYKSLYVIFKNLFTK
tara:strand:+ start:232 stop:930 length:699 start_codon:yes stop_codon:yes gene_type:complete